MDFGASYFALPWAQRRTGNPFFMLFNSISTWRPCQTSTTQHVQMQMVNLLPSILAAINDQAITRFSYAFLFGDHAGGGQEFCRQQRIIEFIQGGHMLLGNDQHMDRGLGIDVAKR